LFFFFPPPLFACVIACLRATFIRLLACIRPAGWFLLSVHKYNYKCYEISSRDYMRTPRLAFFLTRITHMIHIQEVKQAGSHIYRKMITTMAVADIDTYIYYIQLGTFATGV
jgi:hypothetical protein